MIYFLLSKILKLTPFVCDVDLSTTLNKIEESSAITLTWFETNYVKWNSNKCHLLVSRQHYEKMLINIENNRILKNKNVELLGITIDKDLKLDKHVNKIYLKLNTKPNVLSRMRSFLSFDLDVL